jgi:glutamate-1-semialdehyde 2,1-aminomutase
VFHGGSFNGNPLGCAAGRVTLDLLTAERIAAADAHCLEIRTALARTASAFGLDVIITGIGSVAGIAFAADTKRHEDDPSALGLASLFHLAASNEGVFLGPGGIIAVSTAHDAASVSQAVLGLSKALETVAELRT